MFEKTRIQVEALIDDAKAAVIRLLSARIESIDTDVDEIDGRLEEVEVNLEAYRLASLAVGQVVEAQFGLIEMLNMKIARLEADKRERDAQDINAACGPAVSGTVTGRITERRPRDIY